jgi:hypothetical protein
MCAAEPSFVFVRFVLLSVVVVCESPRFCSLHVVIAPPVRFVSVLRLRSRRFGTRRLFV